MTTTNFKILSASAGTGKTYRLAKAYLTLLLRPDSGNTFRNLLAITFTNKAVGEMRQRILTNLQDFAFNNMVAEENSLFKEIAKDLELSSESLKSKSEILLKKLLHNYAFFEITTIDGFNHNLIRTFARDLKIAQNFEVELDTDFLLNNVISRILNKVGVDDTLTKTLIDFSLEKIENDKSWDFAQNLFDIGKLIFNENHYAHLLKLKSKSSADFSSLKTLFKRKKREYDKAIEDSATKCLEQITLSGLEFSDFNRGYFPKFLEQAKKNPEALNFDAKWKQNFGEEPLYISTKPDSVKSTIDSLLSTFTDFFEIIKLSYYHSEFLKRCQKHLVPLSLLAEIIKEFEELKRDEGFLTIPEFNQLIAAELKKQPAPYIYERLGERYHNYFVDEFQDTSILQWNNLVPLISHALESEDLKGQTGSLFLVGDVKQSIYRWRGGEPKQFLDLVVKNEKPFMVQPTVEQLSKNWRSYDEIINFNNSFFSFCADKLANDEYAQAYTDGNQQLPNDKKGGIVSISFLPKKTGESQDENPHCKKTLEVINTIIDKGYHYDDICILVRSRKEGVALADYLQQQNLPIVSSEALLLKSSEEVRFLISFFNVLINPEAKEDVFDILNYLVKEKDGAHDFIFKNLNRFSEFLAEQYDLKIHTLKSLGPLELSQKLILALDLAKSSSAFLNFFIDVVFEFETKNQGSLQDFLNYWHLNNEKLSISFNEGENALQIMTVHKAKGLEFPFVIYPFADSVVNDGTKQNNIWFDVDEKTHAGFSELFVTNNKFMEYYSEQSKNAHWIENEKAELDDFNVLYVALTRAIFGLYVITIPFSKNSSAKKDSYASLFHDYLSNQNIIDENTLEYTFGELQHNLQSKKENPSLPIEYSGQNMLEQSVEIAHADKFISDPEIEKSVLYGNLVHQVLAKVYSEKDIQPAIEEVRIENNLSTESAKGLETTLGNVINHKDLNRYFQEGINAMNEVEILKEDGTLIRPDKIIIEGGNATLIDYKTGAESSNHTTQVNEYAHCLMDMGYKIEDKILVYINDNIKTLAI